MNTGFSAFDRLLLAGAAVLIFLLLGPVLTIPLHIPINYNEGWNANFDLRAVTPGAGPLYPPTDTFVFNNYPPLSFYIVGALGRFVFGDMIVAGRVVALLSILASAGLLGLCVRRLGGDLRASLAAALLMLLFSSTFFHEYVAMDDPQWLAHALMLGGLAVLLRGWPARLFPARNVIPAALLVLAGAFVKHSLVALPLSVTIWLLCVNRRAALLWLATAVAGLAVGLAITDALDGHAAFTDVLHHRRIFLARRLTKAIGRLLPLVPIAVLAVALLNRRPWREPATLFAGLFMALALVTGVAQRGGQGVYYNAHFETMIAVCLAFGLALPPSLAAAPRIRGGVFGPTALTAIAALPIIILLPWHLTRVWHDIRDRHAREAAWRPVIARIAAAPDLAGCEMLSLCFWAGKPFEVDMFNLNQSVLVGVPIDRFKALVNHHRFGIFEYRADSFIHSDAARLIGRDPLIDSFTGVYGQVATGPEGAVLLAPLAGKPTNPAR